MRGTRGMRTPSARGRLVSSRPRRGRCAQRRGAGEEVRVFLCACSAVTSSPRVPRADGVFARSGVGSRRVAQAWRACGGQQGATAVVVPSCCRAVHAIAVGSYVHHHGLPFPAPPHALQDSFLILEMLPAEYDLRVKAMEVRWGMTRDFECGVGLLGALLLLCTCGCAHPASTFLGGYALRVCWIL